MAPKLILFLGVLFAVYALRSQRHRSAGVSSALFWPSLWYMVVSSRMVGLWLVIWGVPIPGSGDPTEGSVIDRSFFFVLMLIGIAILSRRRFAWGAVFRLNPELMFLLLFMAASIAWSSYSFISFKRYVKVIASVIMALVILTEHDPLEAFCTVLRRCFYIHLPMSIICIRYFREIGISWDWSGSAVSWQGISTTKNVLGQVAMVAGVYFFWELKRNWAQKSWKNLDLLYLLQALYLLKGSDSALSLTSLSVFVFALFVFITLHSLRERPPALRTFTTFVFICTVSLITLIVTHSIVHFAAHSMLGNIITAFGRDITLTDRTYIWDDVYAAASVNPLMGVGFGGFWIGRLANIPWNEKMTWVLGQAHSGYVDTYLQIGLIGVFLLVLVIFSNFFRSVRTMLEDFEFGSFRLTFLLTILFVNITESTFLRGDHHLWFLFLTSILVVPFQQRSEAPVDVSSLTDIPPEEFH